MDKHEELLIKGFNNGYLLAKYEPELAAKLTAQVNDRNEYFKGLPQEETIIING